MSTANVDLSALSRVAPETAPPPARVPLPHARWRTRVLLPGALLAATGGLLLYAAGATLWPAVPVHVVPVLSKSGVSGASAPVDGTSGARAVVQAPGWVEPDPYPLAVSALADGVVQEVLVLEGQAVEAGQVVVRLVPDDARLALARVEAESRQATAHLAAVQAALTAAQREWDHPVELTRKLATAEATLAEKQAELERWPAELASAQALTEELRAELDRVTPLRAAGQASDIEYIRARQQYESQRAATDAIRARRPVLEAQVANAQAEVVAARENLRLRIPETRALEEARAAVAAAEAAVAEKQAARDEAALRLERMEVRAPVAGVVMNRMVEPGSKLMLNATEMQSAIAMRLYDPRKLQVRVDVPLADAAQVGVDQPAEIIVDVLPERVFRGRVTRIVNEADVQKNTLQVKVAILDPSPELKPEMLARARFLPVTPPGGPEAGGSLHLFVPEGLLHRMGEGQAHVWLADPARNVATRRLVTIGAGRIDQWVEVTQGLMPGDRLIADAPPALRDGQGIRILGETPATGGAPHGTH